MNSQLKKQISIVIPVYNGESTIAALVEQLIASLADPYMLEIVLVNDDSPDNSEEVCAAIHQKHPQMVKLYSLAKNVGEHNAVMAGLNQTTGEVVIIMDDDFQNPVSEVTKLIEYATAHDFDVVYTYYEEKKHSWIRNLGSQFNDKIANVMLRKPKDLYLSSFKSLNRFIVQEIITYELPYPYIDGLILRTTSKIGKIKVRHHSREIGKSGYTFTKLVRLWLNMFTNFSILPLRVSIVMGFLFSLIGLGLGFVAIVEKFSNPALPIGYASLVVVILIFSGIQLISLGMIGEYLGRIFLSQNKKPQYTIRRKYESTSEHGTS
ncbi:glycosyltransferase family 2 protein [candidate division CSSED10-310 bacterium]|uniref:Glycosyltransferase family 2 protein n=1 Tax=candidate division CSSED10-310 bacterium TaxID=2855610 RepID=A0ABV6YYS0_UNCC1